MKKSINRNSVEIRGTNKTNVGKNDPNTDSYTEGYQEKNKTGKLTKNTPRSKQAPVVETANDIPHGKNGTSSKPKSIKKTTGTEHQGSGTQNSIIEENTKKFEIKQITISKPSIASLKSKPNTTTKQQKSETGTVPKKESRRRSTYFQDLSSDTENDPFGGTPVRYHLLKRLTRFVRLAGIAQFIEEHSSVPRTEVFIPGSSLLQDRSCSIRGYHAGHLVRVQINRSRQSSFQKYLKTLENFIGHTHFVPMYANVWKGLGGAIDRIQSEFLSSVLTINFRRELTSHVKSIMEMLKKAFLEAIYVVIGSARRSAAEIDQLWAAYEAIEGMTLQTLFEKGRVGLTYVEKEMEREEEVKFSVVRIRKEKKETERKLKEEKVRKDEEENQKVNKAKTKAKSDEFVMRRTLEAEE